MQLWQRRGKANLGLAAAGAVIAWLAIVALIVAVPDSVGTAIGAAAQVLASIAALAVVGLTYSYVVATRAMVDEMRTARLSSTRAHVVATAKIVSYLLAIEVKNIGNAPAHDVRVLPQDTAAWFDESTLTLSFIAPDASITRHIDVLTMGKDLSEMAPLPVVCRWTDDSGNEQSARSVVDFRPLAGSIGGEATELGRKIDDVARELKNINSTVRNKR